MKIKTGDLWEKAFSTYDDDIQLRNLQSVEDSVYPNFNALDIIEQKIIRKAGIELMGEELFQQLLSGVNIDAQLTQDLMDEKAIEFIALNTEIKASDTYGNFAYIPQMPDSTILQTEKDEINRLASIMLPSLWNGMPPTFSADTTGNQKSAFW